MGTFDGRSPEERFWPKVDTSGDCWLWAGYVKPNGYATFYPGGGNHIPKVYVHRFAYEAFRGPIPEGFEVDHLCNIRHCVNPDHLEAVTKRENLDRRNATHGWRRLPPPGRPRRLRTHCKHGHPFDEGNTYWHGGYRYCRTCRRNRNAAAA